MSGLFPTFAAAMPTPMRMHLARYTVLITNMIRTLESTEFIFITALVRFTTDARKNLSISVR